MIAEGASPDGNSKVRLRAPEQQDFESFVRWINNPEVWRFIGEGPIFQSPIFAARSGEDNWYEKWIKDPDRRFFSIETAEGRLIGNCQLMCIHWTNREAELAITIGETAYWGKGYGSDAVRQLLALAFDQYNLHRVFLRVIDTNERGRRCYAKCGFQQEGILREAVYVDGAYHDFIMMSILEHEYRHEMVRAGDRS